MRYESRKPGGPLEPFVKCLWRLRGTASEIAPEPIVPDGCFELIVHLGEPFLEQGAKQERLLLAATLTRIVVVAAAGTVDVVGVRFEPGGAYPFLAASPIEAVDRVAPAINVLPRDLVAVLASLEPGPTAELFDRVEAALRVRLDRAGSDPRFDRIVAELVRDEAASVTALAASASTSLRQFERRFKSRAGVSAKVLQRVVRFHRVVTRLLDGSPDLAIVALDAGFSDQSHMSHEFRALAATSPRRYLENPGRLDRLFAGS